MEFHEFFQAIYGNDIEPFPWQNRLANNVLDCGWPSVLDLPTGTGKTSALDIAVYHLVSQLDSIRFDATVQRTAPLRIFFIVDRRIVVDGAFRHARRLADRMQKAKDGPLAYAKELLRSSFDIDSDLPPLHVSLMRGGMYRDNGWTASPVQPTICVSTVDQIGSRLLFRGYGVSPSMRPVHAGLIANDSLMLIDEAHLSEPFLQTLQSVRLYADVRFAERHVSRPPTVVRMSATTPDADSEAPIVPFRIDDADREHPVLKKRLTASKIATFEKITVDKDNIAQADKQFAQAAVNQALQFSESGMAESNTSLMTKKKPVQVETHPAKVIGIVVNRVRTARTIFEQLCERVAKPGEEIADVILLTGRIRPFDRDELLFRADANGKRGWFSWIESGRLEQPQRFVFVVATQTVEVGADIDFDALVTEAAPLDCLRQRFGRLDRRGDRQRSRAVVLGRSTDVAKTANDRVYGDRLTHTWHWLEGKASGKGKNKSIDFGITAMENLLSDADLTPLCADRLNAPILLSPYVELWCRTNPAPAADPDIGLFLHGPNAKPPDVQIVWRADLLANGEDRVLPDYEKGYVATLALLPPTSMEACSVPIYEVIRWLSDEQTIGDIADVEGDRIDDETKALRRRFRHAVRWRGPDNSYIVEPKNIRPGDTIVVPSSYGGHDTFGWNPSSTIAVPDVAESCARWGRAYPVVRCHLGLMRQWLSDEIYSFPSHESEVISFLDRLANHEGIPFAVRQSCQSIVTSGAHRLVPYETDDTDTDGWLVFGRKKVGFDQILRETRGDIEDSTEDEAAPDSDDSSSFIGSGVPISLDEHTDGVIQHVERFARRAGLADNLRDDLLLAAQWHDVGKIDERFQTLLHDGDAVEAIVAIASGKPLAKSGQTYRNRAAMLRARRLAGVPAGFRHEALSVVLLRMTDLRNALAEASDTELVEYLIGSHHGNGRPSHPAVRDEPPRIDATWRGHCITIETANQLSAALYRLDNDWEGLFARLNRRYGPWGLAWLEAVFRLADHRQSSIDATKTESESAETIARTEVATT